ncbi:MULTISPECIES: aminotransferase class I/II-fold pyridoxal phosphate-dependent enzyme [Pseudothermotoga]|jgi:histidinol-phosphate aminotransferase|uniref:aminotransferase class I/II-fold pyridoxal phosphate-dependent enzyme n=1 Tax=Pseudothermotoga TaxID=1643951 RepID=UPI0004237402|nr:MULTISPECIES: aminotransferase class I/II-fold pyridoxal phosphate-dependent enzyme [Pseudothermotoga]KUK20516.1 MAG: Aminotransferase class I and II [Pseudothermotoga lettingae]MDI3495404.1 histidinol-phosphate aminotransferase [Pseudothermotoga sp.]MDK2884391.1 histidinol-phosphate aminotransferase [Pseudothermotoga sp.]HBT26847.1 aminotransferase [Pseudothermotoga sp.]
MKIFHGGINREEFTDFSISVNPIKPPFFEKLFSNKLVEYCGKYTYIEQLEEKFAKRYGENTVILAGATEALQIIGFTLMEDSEVIIPIPSYGEYARIASFKAHRIHFVDILDYKNRKLDYSILENYIKDLKRKNRSGKNTVIILGNPNNPTGYYEKNIASFVDRNIDERTTLVIDEAFVDFIPEKDRVDLSDFENTILIRTFTKFYSIPGIRAGYVKSKNFKSLFESYRSPWAVGAMGYLFLETLLREDIYALNRFEKNTVEYTERERKKFEDFTYFISNTNYFVAEIGDVEKFLQILHHNKMHVRTMYDFKMPKFVRIGLKDEQSNEKLLNLLRDWRESYGLHSRLYR